MSGADTGRPDREFEYLSRLSELNTAKILGLGAKSITIRHELEQKRRGFALLSELSSSLRNRTDHESIFAPAARRINAALNMQRTAVLMPDEEGRSKSEGRFKAIVLQGYPKEEMDLVPSRGIEVDPEFLNPTPVLITGADSPERLSKLRVALRLPYMISSPTILYDKTVAALLITGRTVEAPPYLSRLGLGDVENVQAISALLAAILVEKRLWDDLRMARDLAEKSSKAKGEFLANISHEVHTPMNAILGMARMLAKSGLDEQQRRNVEYITQSTHLLLRVFNDILDFTNFDTGNLELHVSPFSIRGAADKVYSIIEERARRKSLSFDMLVEPDVPGIILGDQERVEQVLFNLIDNSVKFTDSGRVSIRIACKPLTAEEIQLTLEVDDTGIGMSQGEVSELFTPFSQADASFTRKRGGTGLGLAICQSLAHLMRGEILCESRPGEGSKFTFTAPFQLPGNAPERGPDKKDAGQAGLEALRGLRVLLVEDNEINQMVTMDMLNGVGACASVAENGLKALENLKHEEYDLILMDIQMPEMDGLTATMRIRANPKYKDLPIVALTAHALPEDREASLKSGMNDHITKPVEPERLYSVLRQWSNRN